MNLLITQVCPECGGLGVMSDGIPLRDGDKITGKLRDVCMRCGGFGTITTEIRKCVKVEAMEA